MSTKLYSGLIADTNDTFALADTIRERMSVVAEEAKQAQFGDDLTRVWDLALHGLPEDSPIPTDASAAVAATLYRMDQDRADSSPEGTNNGPLDWQVTVLPHDETSVLLLVHAANPAYREALLETPGIEDYSYWDNTDQPEDVPSVQWRDRHSAWARALAPDWVPANHGFCVSTSAWGRGILDEHQDDAWVLGALRSQPSLRSRLVTPLTSRAAQHIPRAEFPSVLPGIVMDVARALQDASDSAIAALAPTLRPLTLEDARGVLPRRTPVLDDSAAETFLDSLQLETS